jgi:hypothetical protein
MRKPGAYVETKGTIMPDANDEAMAARIHEAEPVADDTKEVTTDVEE